ncbi:hypothetical protein, conserved [Eimeria brunetti]|uniref:Uncharacterized protein n=1 Tax=Eimeria brunetti TaxID=51314 RepID=U6LX40_9EIME|nr:hypothetical protein, conserved [Eimeria brunetti]
MKGKMPSDTPPVSLYRSLARRERSGVRLGSMHSSSGGKGGGDRELRLDGNSSEDAAVSVSDLREERRARASRHRRSISSSWGLGEGVSGKMTAVAILGLLLLSIGIPTAVLKLYKEQGEQQQQQLLLEGLGEEQQAAADEEEEQQLDDSLDTGRLPLTRNLHGAFLALRHTGDFGLLLSVKGPEWDYLRGEFLATIERVAEMPASSFLNTINKSQEALRLMMAMDLACLENAAVETKLAIEDERAAQAGGYTAEMAERYQRNMHARRQQLKAVDLWERKVVKNQLGAEPGLKDSLMKLLLAVRSRAAASEYLTAAAAEVRLSAAPSNRTHAEENRIQEGVAYLVKAGQLAATDQLVREQVVPWLAILFAAF